MSLPQASLEWFSWACSMLPDLPAPLLQLQAGASAILAAALALCSLLLRTCLPAAFTPQRGCGAA